MRAAGAFTVCVLLLLPWPASAQGLGNASRKEKERRTKVSEPAKSYSNTDLPDRPAQAAEPESNAQVSTSPGSGDAAAPVTAAVGEASPSASAASEASWRARGAAARQRVEAAERKVADLEKKGASQGLTVTMAPCVRPAGFQGPDRPCYSASGSDPLGAARAELDAARSAKDALDDSARRANVPPGWLR
jgi:hypothetical protein